MSFCLPAEQVSSQAKAYSSLSWAYLLKHLRQMAIADAFMEEGVDWSVKLDDKGGLLRDH